MRLRSRRFSLLFLCRLLPLRPAAPAYSPLTHEQFIDLTWQSSIVPLLLSLKIIPTSTELDPFPTFDETPQPQ